MFGFGGNLVNKAPIEHGSRFAHAFSGAEKMSGVKVNFINPLLIQAPFDPFMTVITGRDEKPLVNWMVRVG